jgi:putative ABC transport system permease protein
VTQIALAVVLLAGGGLLARTITGLLHADIGVTTRGAAVTQLLLTEGMSFAAHARAPVVQQIVDRVRALPNVTAAGVGSTMPPDNSTFEVTVRFVRDTGESMHRFAASSVTPGFLPALGARLLQGRDFAPGDDRFERPVVVLSESAARAFFPNERDVVNQDLPMALPGPMRVRGRPRVIGVVSDIKYAGLAADAGPSLYVMWNEFPAGHTFLAVRTAREDPLALATSLRGIIRDADARIPAMPIRSLDEVVQRSVSDKRLNAMLGTSIALLAFAVAMVGLAASLMRVVSERRQELAIRAALGATPGRAIRSVVGEGALLAGLGVVLGCAGALGVGRALGTLLHGVSPHDPLTLTAVMLFVAAASLLACYLPARRAAQVEPIAALRAE